MLEVTIAAVVLVIGMLALITSITASLRLVETNRETALAHQAARSLAERMQNLTFSQIFATYNASTADDPGGAGTAPGAAFDVPGLRVPIGRGHGHAAAIARVGSVQFPTLATGQLSEDRVDADLGMPRDLNGDGVVTAGAMPGNYLVLPVRIRIQWQGAGGFRSVVLHSLLINR